MPKKGIIRAGRLLELEAVAAVARHRSFRRAALEVGLSTTALSRTVAALEERLGIQLFMRTTRSVAPTPAGERFIGRVVPALGEIGAALDDAADQRDTPSGAIRINCSSGAARRVMEPLLLPFAARYPDVTIELVTEGRLIDIVEQGFDAGIRQCGSVPADMEKVQIAGPTRFVVVCSPAYLAGREPPQHPMDLEQHRCIRIQLASGLPYRWEFFNGGSGLEIDVCGTLLLDDPSLMRRAALAGAGLAYLADWRVADDVAAGTLIPLLCDWMSEEDGLYLYHPSRRHPSAALRALIAAIDDLQPPG
ncbi:LysR family transcriptional regulator [Sphingobium sp. PNB]|uniref:LysR family transcriptional regulator n=1 Tax=Sphingobium sp. PNB TaxID=863934 RepID=UPI001CA3870B|nr:LysR family transcriptional regulator [Sphingobium sp. PNB]MCB4859659.1 LysR family transcriptional regulator [Sphingobium sp. PNB]